MRPDYEICRQCGEVHMKREAMSRPSNWRAHQCKKSLTVNLDEGAFNNDEPTIGPCDAAGMQSLQQELDQLAASEVQHGGDDTMIAAADIDCSQDHQQLAAGSEEDDDDEVEQPQPAAVKRAKTDQGAILVQAGESRAPIGT